jgi:hypothetical protein
VLITTALTSASAITAAVSVLVSSKPNLRAACRPLTPAFDATTLSRAPVALKAGISTAVA